MDWVFFAHVMSPDFARSGRLPSASKSLYRYRCLATQVPLQQRLPEEPVALHARYRGARGCGNA